MSLLGGIGNAGTDKVLNAGAGIGAVTGAELAGMITSQTATVFLGPFTILGAIIGGAIGAEKS